MGGHWGLSETEKPAKISIKTEKPEEKSIETEKPAENNAQNHKFVVFNPSTLDTTAKYMALGTNQCPCYTAYSADSKRCSLSQRKFLQCSTKAVASSIAFASCEGETFAMNSGSFLQCANCWQELCRIIRLTQYFNTDHLRLMPRNWPWIPLMTHAVEMSSLPKTVKHILFGCLILKENWFWKTEAQI